MSQIVTPTIQKEATKKTENQRMRQSTITGQKQPTSQAGAQPGDPKTSQQAEVWPTVNEAMQFLVDHGYHSKSVPITVTSLGEITLKICSRTKMAEIKHMLEGMRSVGIILKELGTEVVKQVMRSKSADGMIKEIKEEITKKSTEQRQELEAVKQAAEKSGKESRELMTKIADGMTTMSEKLKELEENIKNRAQVTAHEAAARNEGPTYAMATTTGGPPRNYARVIARAEEAERQIVITGKDKNKETAEGLKTERELIAKAEMTLKLMTEGGVESPARTKFIGGFRTKAGAIIYTLNSKEAAHWLKHPDRLKAFNEKFGDSAQAHGKLFNIIAYYVPISFDADSTAARANLETDNDLALHSLKHTRYIKPAHKRSKNQTAAHLILGFSSRAEANEAIARGWLRIAEKNVAVRKLVAEPRRCYKCQSVKGDHTANTCQEKESKCARCAGTHSTRLCLQPENIRCVNCHSPNHGAGDRTCPAFIQSVNEHKQRNSEGNYRYYPIIGDIRTMELIDGSYGPDFPDFPDASKGNGGTKGQREPHGHDQENPQDEEEEEAVTSQGATGKFGVLRPVSSWEEENPGMQNINQGQFQFSVFD